jgi:Protein of unknown function (DUF1838)
VNKHTITRFGFTLTCAVVSALAIGAAHARPARQAATPPAPPPPPRIDLTTPEGVVAANRKMGCDLRDGVPVTYYWAGDAYSRRQGEADKLLFRAEGMNIRQCVTVTDPVRGAGYKMVSRELLIYRDVRTGEVLKRWTNPWTNETVDVLHVANDPVNSASYVKGRDGNPVRWTGTILGDTWMSSTTVPLFYSNPLAGAYQAEVGGTYHATEMFNFSGSVANLLDPLITTAAARITWVRVSDWLPWMKMGGREGVIYFNTTGLKLDKFDDMPAPLKTELLASYPSYVSPPPLDDTRPNETSWTYFRDVREGKKAAPKRD